MSGNIKATALILCVTFSLFGTGCYKVTTVTISNSQEVTTPVSMKDDLVPLFTANCAKSGCHNDGGIKPDLSADKAYNSLVNGNYLDVGSPENSEIYLWLTGKKAVAMPVGAANNPSNINALVLAWIKQGAKNN